MVLQTQVKATTTKTTDKISARTFEKHCSEHQASWPAQPPPLLLTVLCNFASKKLSPLLLHQHFISKHLCTSFFAVSYVYKCVQEPICICTRWCSCKEPSLGSDALARETSRYHNAVYLRKLGDLHFYLTNNPSTSRKWIFLELSSTVLSAVPHLGLLSHLELFMSPVR